MLDAVLARLKKLGPFTVTTSSKAITLYTPAGKAFAVLQPRRAALDLWFPLNRPIGEYPVFKTLQPSRNRYANFVRLKDAPDLSPRVVEWIGEAYQANAADAARSLS